MAGCQHFSSLSAWRDALEDIEHLRSARRAEIFPLVFDDVSGFCCLDYVDASLDELFELGNGKNVDLGNFISAAPLHEFHNLLSVNQKLVLGANVVATRNLVVLDLKLQLVLLVAHQLQK